MKEERRVKETKVSRRRFLEMSGAGLFGAAMLGVAGCGGGGGGGQGGGDGGGGQGNVTLNWWDFYSDLPETSKAINAAIRQYEKENPNVKINRTVVGFADLKPRLIQATATGKVPDVVIIDNPDHQSFADQGTLADLTQYISQWPARNQYFPGPWKSTMYDGKNYGVPFESNATALFYNEDALKKAGVARPPETWDEVLSAGKKLSTGGQSGFLFSAAATEEGTFTFLPFLWQAGGDVPTVGDAASVKALSFWKELVDSGITSKAVTSYGQADVYNQFVAGKAAMMINGPWQLPQLATDKPDFSWNVAPWPRDREKASILGGENFAAGNGQNVEAAWNVIKWMAEPRHVKKPLLTIGLPNRKDMANDKAWTSDPRKEVFISQVEIARPRAYGPNYPKISEQIWTMFQQALTGDASPEQAAQQAGEAIKPLLK
jgi:multiple sugar transport system substrate-binding protein